MQLSDTANLMLLKSGDQISDDLLDKSNSKTVNVRVEEKMAATYV